MSFQGSGTGSLNYQIQNEQSVNATCVVQALEDDSAGTLTLNVSFVDAIHGQVQVGISLFDYAADTTTYQNIAYLMIGFQCQTPSGGWSSDSGSSVYLFINQQSGSGSVTYSGHFNAGNLIWAGPGNQNTLAIKFAAFSFQVTADSSIGEAPEYRTAAGTGTVTSQVGAELSESVLAAAGTVTYDSAGQPSIVVLNLTWTDPVQGTVMAMLVIDPFHGTGIYSPTMKFATTLAKAGNWAADRVTFEATYKEEDPVARWQGSLLAPGLVWVGEGSQPNVDVILRAIALNLHLS